MTTQPIALKKQVRRFEICALVLRGIAVAWGALTVLTFAGLCASGDYDSSMPFLFGGTMLALFFLVVLCWPIRRDIRNGLSRIILVLRWQVTTGVVIAFTLGFVVREELQMSFWLVGSYLVIPALFLMLLRLNELGLRTRYAAMDDLARAEERSASMSELALATATHLTEMGNHKSCRGWIRLFTAN